MSDLRAIADRVEIEALRGEFTDAGMVRDFDRLASLFTDDAVWAIPAAGIEFVGREKIGAGIKQLQQNWEFFVQNTHSGMVRVDGNVAVGRAFVAELGRFRDGSSHLNYAIYHDRYRRTPDGWKFVERSYEVRYYDTTALPGTYVNPWDPPRGDHAR